ncbi:MAG: FHA domain-containing protein, partial [Planctomycetia bacterium]|nr:FHA domain-containing protein [Planctomycetia bacterium]
MRARLCVENGEGSPSTYDLAPGQPATLGRSRDSSVVIKDDLASRLHAKVYFEDGRWVVRDFGLNGTKVNGSKVTGAAELNDGSVIQIGDAVVRFQAVSGSTVTPPPVARATDTLPLYTNGKPGLDRR